MTARVLLVGLDAADASLVDRWTADGSMPVLAALRARGVSGTVTSPRALGDDGVWCTFATGFGPGHHGRRYHDRYLPGTYEWVVAYADRIPIDSFWGVLGEQGKRFLTVDVPKSRRGDAPGNLIVADWLAHHAHTMRTFVRTDRPAVGLPRDGVYEPAWNCHSFQASEPASFVSELLGRSAELTRLFVDRLTHADYDAAIVVFGGTHCVGHEAWHEPEVVHAVYRDIDAHIAEIVDAAGTDAVVIVFSLLGMGPNRDGTFLLDAVLRRLDDVDGAAPVGEVDRLKRALVWARTQTPRWLRRVSPAAARQLAVDLRTRDLSKRRFWVVPTDLAATPVRLNVVGREPHGKVNPGAYDRVCLELTAALRDLKHPDTGAPLVHDVLRADEIAPGPEPQDFADLHVVWNDTGPLVAAESSRVGEVRIELPALRTGNHVEGGWFVAAGPGLDAVRLRDPASTVDFAPTVAHLVGGTFDGEGRCISALARALRTTRDG